MANIAYIRVSTEDQNTARQDRPELQKLMEYVREGDVVYVESISRFGRSLQDLLTLINQLNDKGVQFKSLKEGDIDTTTPTGKLVFSIFASLAEFERETIKQRQAEEIAIAKAKGVYKGRIKKDVDPVKFRTLYDKWQSGEIKKKYMTKKLGISLATLDRRIAQYRKPGK